MPKLIKGENLTPAQVQYVKSAFVYRLTTENGYPQRNPCNARVPAISDAQWIEERAFWFNNDGTPCHARGKSHAEPAFLAD